MSPRSFRQTPEEDPRIILLVELTRDVGTIKVISTEVMDLETGRDAVVRATGVLQQQRELITEVEPRDHSRSPACVCEISWRLRTPSLGDDPYRSEGHLEVLVMAIDAIVEPHLETMDTDDLVVVDTQGNPLAF